MSGRKYIRFAVFTAALLLAAYSCKQLSGHRVERQKIHYPSGVLKSETVFRKGRLERVTLYYPGGSRQSDCSYADGVEGPCTQYFEDGKILMYYFYKHHQPEGRAYSNYAGGQLAYERFYKDGYKTGTWKYYNEDGSLREADRFQDHKTLANDEHDYSDNQYYLNNKPAYTVMMRDGKYTDTLVHDATAAATLLTVSGPVGGKGLFMSYCAQCHHPVRDATGPLMKGVVQTRSKEWLIKMITNGRELISSGDTAAVSLYEKWNKMQHPDFTDELSQQQVLLLIDYLATIR